MISARFHTCDAQMLECTIVTTKDHSTLCIFYSCYIVLNKENKIPENDEAFYWQQGGWSGIAYKNNTNKMHSSHQQPSGKPLKFLSTQGHEVVQNFDPTAPKLNEVGCVCLCFCSSPASRSSVVSTHPPSSHQTQGTQPCCHIAQAPQRLRFPLGLNEVFSVSHIVGIQHQSVYWSPCSSSLSPSFLFLFYLSLFFSFHNTPSLHGIHTK